MKTVSDIRQPMLYYVTKKLYYFYSFEDILEFNLVVWGSLAHLRQLSLIFNFHLHTRVHIIKNKLTKTSNPNSVACFPSLKQ